MVCRSLEETVEDDARKPGDRIRVWPPYREQPPAQPPKTKTPKPKPPEPKTPKHATPKQKKPKDKKNRPLFHRGFGQI